MNLSPFTRHAFPHPQRGVASVAIAALILFILGAALATALSMSGSAARDAAMSEEQVEALFLAESGVENASRRLANGTTCGTGVGFLAPYSRSFGAGTFNIVSANLVSGNCVIQVTGTVRGATRTVDVTVVNPSGSNIAVEAGASQGDNNNVMTRTISFTVGGIGRVLVVGITVDTANSSTVSTVTYAGVALGRPATAGSSPLTEIWTLANPATGTNDLIVTLTGFDQMAVGVLSFTGADTSSPTSHLDVPAVSAFSTTNGNTASVSITPVTNNAWIVDTVSVNRGVLTTMTSMTNRLERWNLRLGGSVTGAGSTLGPISPAAARTLTWTWGSDRSWSQAAIALRPGGSPSVRQWSEVVN